MKQESFKIIENWMGKDYVQLIDPANNQNSMFIRFKHNDNNLIREQKLNNVKEKLKAERIK